MRLCTYRMMFSARRRSIVMPSMAIMHLFSTLHQPRTTEISQPPWRRHAYAMCKKTYNNGFASLPPVSGIAFYSNESSSSHSSQEDMDIEIISKEEIKPASPTPDHRRIHKISLFDQINHHCYPVPFVYFYPKNHGTKPTDDIISEKRQRLKQSLSETLVQFYPIAGRIKDNIQVDCNDAGVYYVEARMKVHLSDFLRQPANKSLNRLLPIYPGSLELLSKTYLAMIQISIFDCGGISIGIYTSHKIVDGLTRLTFMKAWAASARESSEKIHPSFISSSVFLPESSLSEHSPQEIWSQPGEQHNFVTRRFVFDHSSLSSLKTQAANSSFSINPSSVTVVMGLLWKSYIAASKVRCGTQKQSFLVVPVDLRRMKSPPLPNHSFGNIFWVVVAKCPKNSNVELKVLTNEIRKAIATINDDFFEDLQGEDRIIKLLGPMKQMTEICSNGETERFTITSICKIGLYEVDFGWGKPIWTCIGTGGTDLYRLENVAVLMDTRSGDGIEAWVTIKQDDMVIFEKDPDILAFASLDPSPLQI